MTPLQEAWGRLGEVRRLSFVARSHKDEELAYTDH